MIKDHFYEIVRGSDIRNQLIALRREISDKEGKEQLSGLLAGRENVLTDLLKDKDPKIRKNAAGVLGDLGEAFALPLLFDAYEAENTLYARAAYLKAMENLDCSAYVERLILAEKRLEALKPTEETRKHRQEELNALRSLLSNYVDHTPNRFVPPKVLPEVIVLVNRCQRDFVAKQIVQGQVRRLGAGLRITGASLQELLRLRTYEELLFAIPSCESVSGSPEEIGSALAGADIPSFLDSMHEGESPYQYRIELRGKLLPEKKGAFIRRVADALEQGSKSRLVNSTSDYDVELRLLQRKDNSFVPCLKLFTIPDERFSYRKGITAESISPVNAALCAALARPWLKEGAVVLDPFCGVGTMLVERNALVHAKKLDGVDIFAEATWLGRENAARSGVPVNFVNCDFADFTHDQRYDEIISDLPRQYRESQTGEMVVPKQLYHDFFVKLPSLLKDEAVLILYTPLGDLIKEGVNSDYRFECRRVFPMNERNGTSLYVIGYRNR